MTTAPTAHLGAVLAGPIALLSDGKTPSAMGKRRLDGPVAVGPEGILTDAQADRSVHGGPDKALLHYAFEHYDLWRSDLADDLPAPLAGPGAFGENLSATGLVEDDIHIGDVFRIGGVLVEVTQARKPCFKLNLFHGRPDIAYRVTKTGRTGWYYRVLETSSLAAGDTVALVDRPNPAWPLPRARALLLPDADDRAAIADLAALPALAEAWRRPLLARLDALAG